VHPGRSGESSLEYLLDGLATVPPDRGIFLPTTWRMCPDVCRFISDAVYDGRLETEPKNANQTLVLGAKPHPALKPTGVVFWPMNHTGCSQKIAGGSAGDRSDLPEPAQAGLLVRSRRQKAPPDTQRHTSSRPGQPAG